jgi:hypothetical protein
MCASRAGGVGDAELVGVQEQSGSVRDLERLFLLVKPELFGHDAVDQAVAEGLRESSVFAIRSFCLKGMRIHVFRCLLLVVELQNATSQRSARPGRKEKSREHAYLVLGEGIVALLNQILDFLHPLGKPRPGSVKKGLGSRIVAVSIELLKSLLVLLEVVKRSIHVRVNSHDQSCVNLNLV